MTYLKIKLTATISTDPKASELRRYLMCKPPNLSQLITLITQFHVKFLLHKTVFKKISSSCNKFQQCTGQKFHIKKTPHSLPKWVNGKIRVW